MTNKAKKAFVDKLMKAYYETQAELIELINTLERYEDDKLKQADVLATLDAVKSYIQKKNRGL